MTRPGTLLRGPWLGPEEHPAAPRRDLPDPVRSTPVSPGVRIGQPDPVARWGWVGAGLLLAGVIALAAYAAGLPVLAAFMGGR